MNTTKNDINEVSNLFEDLPEDEFDAYSKKIAEEEREYVERAKSNMDAFVQIVKQIFPDDDR